MYKSTYLRIATVPLQKLGAAAARRRNQLQLSQRKLAELVGLSQSTISRFERGLVPGLRLEHFAAILTVLGLIKSLTYSAIARYCDPAGGRRRSIGPNVMP